MRPPLQVNQLQNPNFTGGSSAGWTLDTGWTIAQDGPGGPWNGVFAANGTGSITNVVQIAVQFGANIAASCWAFMNTKALGQGFLELIFYDKNGNNLGGPRAQLLGRKIWTQLVISAPAPLAASYAMVRYSVYNDTSFPPTYQGWWCKEFYAANRLTVSYEPISYKQPLQYYLNLFTSQYRMSAKLNQWQAALMQPIDDLTNCLQTVNGNYDIDNAIGTQLDVIGEILGQSRTLPFQPSGGVSPVLNDEDYRLLLYATQAKNEWDGKIGSLYSIWRFLFPNGSLVINDNQNMTATVTSSGEFTSIQQDLINNGFIVPRPEGVQYNPGGTGVGLFGFDRNDAAVSGFDIGMFA